MIDCYKLGDDHVPVPCTMDEAASQMQMSKRLLRRTNTWDAIVSTVFLVFDHATPLLGDGPHVPLLFETMVFGGEHDGYQRRYATYDDAIAQHDRVAWNLLRGRDPDAEDAE